MAKQIIDYRILEDMNIDLLDREVTKFIQDGYRPFGAPGKAFKDGCNTNYQAIIKYRSWRILELLESFFKRGGIK